MKTAIYLIASNDTELNNCQLTLLIERIKSEGKQYTIFSEITDKKGNQLLKEDLLARVYKNEFDTILVYRLSDWSNSQAEMSSELSELHKRCVRVISISENFDSFTPTGNLYINMLLAFSEFETAINSSIPEESTSKIEMDNRQLTGKPKTRKRVAEESAQGLSIIHSKILSDDIDKSGIDTIPGMISRSGKTCGKNDNFDLVGLEEACELTGYSKHTLYQLTSKKLIPHFKRPRGRRIFFSKRALEQWIMTGGI